MTHSSNLFKQFQLPVNISPEVSALFQCHSNWFDPARYLLDGLGFSSLSLASVALWISICSGQPYSCSLPVRLDWFPFNFIRVGFIFSCRLVRAGSAAIQYHSNCVRFEFYVIHFILILGFKLVVANCLPVLSHWYAGWFMMDFTWAILIFGFNFSKLARSLFGQNRYGTVIISVKRSV